MVPAAPQASAVSGPQGQAPLRVYYDRVAIALLGCLSILALVVGGILALAGVLTGWVPLIGLLVGVGSFASLRTLAVRGRRAKLLARMEATRKLAMETTVEPVFQAPRKQTPVFDAQPDSNKRAPRLTVQELRAEALRIAAKGSPVQRPEGWAPTEVPLPQYVVANAAPRPAPEALVPAVEPKASSSATLRAQEASKQLAREIQAASESAKQESSSVQQVSPAMPESVEKSTGEKSTAPVEVIETVEADSAVSEATAAKARAERASRAGSRINLDDVMQRRRA